MYIAPNSDIWLCSGIPFDMSYDNTKLYPNKESQFTDISSKALLHLTDLSYIREESEIMVDASPAILYKCNYIIFKNTNFENRYFYAFITGFRYINNDCYGVKYSIDVFQTWMFDYTMKSCFIDRAHVEDDSIGANRVPEGLETGEFCYYYATTPPRGPYYICVAATFDANYNDAVGSVTNGVYSGLIIHHFTSAANANSFISGAINAGKSDGIVSMYMAEGPGYITEATITRTDSQQKYKPFGGYIPKNNKLYTYPYTFLTVTNNNGNAANYRWEEFNNNQAATFKIYSSDTLQPDLLLVPTGYNTEYGNTADNTTGMMYLGGFPQCSWNVDTYKAWLAQNANTLYFTEAMAKVEIAVGAVNMGIGLFGGGTFGTGINQVVSGAKAIGELESAKRDKDILAPQARVVSGSRDLTYMAGYCMFTFYRMSIREEFAKKIDDYFTRYGYAVHEMGVPNLSSRESYNYIRTVGCLINAQCPADDALQIQQIYDKGITIWHVALDNIGDYTLNNDPVVG